MGRIPLPNDIIVRIFKYLIDSMIFRGMLDINNLSLASKQFYRAYCSQSLWIDIYREYRLGDEKLLFIRNNDGTFKDWKTIRQKLFIFIEAFHLHNTDETWDMRFLEPFDNRPPNLKYRRTFNFHPIFMNNTRYRYSGTDVIVEDKDGMLIYFSSYFIFNRTPDGLPVKITEINKDREYDEAPLYIIGIKKGPSNPVRVKAFFKITDDTIVRKYDEIVPHRKDYKVFNKFCKEYPERSMLLRLDIIDKENCATYWTLLRLDLHDYVLDSKR